MMQTEGDPSLKLRSSFSLNLELEVAEALTDLAKPLEINIPEQPEAFSPSIDESLEPTSPLHLALWTDNQVGGGLFILYYIYYIPLIMVFY